MKLFYEKNHKVPECVLRRSSKLSSTASRALASVAVNVHYNARQVHYATAVVVSVRNVL